MSTQRITISAACLMLAAAGYSTASAQEASDYTVEQAVQAFSCEAMNRSTLPDGSCGSRFADTVEDSENSRFIGVVGKSKPESSSPAKPASTSRPQQADQLTLPKKSGNLPAGYEPLPQLPGARDLQIEFENASVELTEKAKANAKVFAQALNSPTLKNLRFAIDGHANAIGSSDYNEGLSLRRAQAVVDYLVGLGVKRSRLDIHGYGYTRPVNAEDPRADENRRVEARRLDISEE